MLSPQLTSTDWHASACYCAPSSVLPTPRKNLNEAQTAELIRVAALPPERRQQAYTAVMQNILQGWTLFKQWGVDLGMKFLKVRTLCICSM